MQDLILRARELARHQREMLVPAEQCIDPELIESLADCIDRYREALPAASFYKGRAQFDRFQGENDQM